MLRSPLVRFAVGVVTVASVLALLGLTAVHTWEVTFTDVMVFLGGGGVLACCINFWMRAAEVDREPPRPTPTGKPMSKPELQARIAQLEKENFEIIARARRATLKDEGSS